jgi:hypothetical protein
LVTWRSNTWMVSNTSVRRYSLSLKIKNISFQDEEWWLPSVYDPSHDEDKSSFLTELHELTQVRLGPWLLCGDFNMIYKAEDKNNKRLNRRWTGQFQHFLIDASLKEIQLDGCLFTWINEHSHPTLERIDRAFISPDWEVIYPHHFMHSLASLCSVHAPMLLRTDNLFSPKKTFHFRCFWPKYPGFWRLSRGRGIALCSLLVL